MRNKQRMGGWLRLLGEIQAQLVSAEFAEPGEPAYVSDDQLMGLLKQAHTMYVETQREWAANRAAAETADQRDDATPVTCCAAPGGCIYMWASGATDASVRDLVRRIAALQHVHGAGAQRDELFAELLSLRPARARNTQVSLCSITGMPCRRAGEEEMDEQLAQEARRLLEYARKVVRGRVLEAELHAELSGGAVGVAASDVEAVLQHTPARDWGRSLLDVLPADDALANEIFTRTRSMQGGAACDLVTPVLDALPPRSQHAAALASAQHAVLQRWYRRLMKM